MRRRANRPGEDRIEPNRPVREHREQDARGDAERHDVHKVGAEEAARACNRQRQQNERTVCVSKVLQPATRLNAESLP
jgi:hypothetical protein